MAYDTIKLKSPPLPEYLVRQVEQQCIMRSGLDLASGELLYELFTGDLLGSWDSRISVKPMWEDWTLDKNGRPRKSLSEPYLLVEASVHKVQQGHNVYGGPTNFAEAAKTLVHLIEELLDIELPVTSEWTVHRVDVANVYALSRAGCKEFFDSIQLRNFPRRQKKAAKYDMAVYFPGKTTTVKFYHKGDEFKIHDMARIRAFYRFAFTEIYGHDLKNTERVERKVKALHRLANNRLRVEVEIHSDKLQYDFDRNPKVSEVTDEYLNAIHDKEIERLLREGKQAMETVRTNNAVMTRLINEYGQATGMRLYGFWSSLCTQNEDVIRRGLSKTVYYRNRKLLEEAGVSWRNSNIHVTSNDLITHDFVPFRGNHRYCSAPARSRPEFQLRRAA